VQNYGGGVCSLRAKHAPGNVQIHQALDLQLRAQSLGTSGSWHSSWLLPCLLRWL